MHYLERIQEEIGRLFRRGSTAEPPYPDGYEESVWMVDLVPGSQDGLGLSRKEEELLIK